MADLYSPENYKKLFPQPVLDSKFTKGRFQDKVAIVTGGASGIGRATVERLSNDGSSVAIFDINDTQGISLQEELQGEGRNVKFYKVDVSDRDQCLQNVQSVADDNGGRIHILVNNAANFGPVTENRSKDQGPVKEFEFSQEIWNKMMSVNVIGCSNMTQACYPFMAKDGKECSIVNVSSLSGNVARRKHAPYSASKMAIQVLSKCAALDLSKSGIRVNSVSPAMVWTPIWASEVKESSLRGRELADQKCARILMTGGAVEGAGCAAAIAFLSSKDAMFITGTDLRVDGGYGAMGPEGLGK